MNQTAELLNRFETFYGQQARVFRAPGRVNLIGEHTDYNDGFVMPAAIQLCTFVAAERRADRKLIIYSENFERQCEFMLDDNHHRPHGDWSDYVRGVAVILNQCGFHLAGANLLIRGEVPIGSGLGSSAALEVATAQALLAIAGISLDAAEIAHLCQRAENEFVGMNCGIMDQFASCCARAGHALMLDCRSLDYRMVPLPSTARIVICNTMVHHHLTGGEYNRRREECESGVRLLKRFFRSIQALRDISPAEFESCQRDLPEIVYRRCRHVITENARVERAAAALETNDLDTFGRLMCESHFSLREDYEVSCDELDLMVGLASRVKGVYGTRMTGAGFGGCTVSLVQSERVAEFASSISEGYRLATGQEPAVWVCRSVDGAAEVTSTE